MKQQNQNLLYVLDSFSHRDIKKWKKNYTEISEYCWDHYAYLAHKRSLIRDQLKESLLRHTKPFHFSDWCRVVDYRFSNHPLSTRGSFLNDPGGRFNIGDIDEIKFPKFSGLYLAEDPETALREKCGLDPNVNQDGLSGREINLVRDMSVVQVMGSLSTILDLTDPNTLDDFYNQIKIITLPTQFIVRAKKLKIHTMIPVRSKEELLDTHKNTEKMPYYLSRKFQTIRFFY